MSSIKKKAKVTKEPYSGVGAFIGGTAGVLITVGFGLSGPIGWLLAGGLAAWGFGCGKWQANKDAELIEAASEKSAAGVTRYFANDPDFLEGENRISVDADGMTPLGKFVFGSKLEVTRRYKVEDS